MNHTAPKPARHDIETPATEGKKHHETLYGSIARSKWIWQIGFFCVVVWGIVQEVNHIRLTGEKQYVPYVVEGYAEGSVRKVGVLEPLLQPTEYMIKAWLCDEFIQGIRGRTMDPTFNRKLWTRANFHTTEKSHNLLATTYQDAKPEQAKGTVQISVSQFLLQGGTTYFVQWTEEKFTDQLLRERNGFSKWSGLFTVTIRKPTTNKEVDENPYGIWIEDWSIRQENS